MARFKKLSDKEFLAILRENSGLFTRTAKAIQEKYKTTFTRQSVRDRALRFPAELADIHEQNLDVAESGLFDLMQSADEKVKFQSISLFLKTIGSKRGYIETKKLEIIAPEIKAAAAMFQNFVNKGIEREEALKQAVEAAKEQGFEVTEDEVLGASVIG